MKTNPTRHLKAVFNEYDSLLGEGAHLDENWYCLTDSQVKALLPHVEPMGWLTRWFSASKQVMDADVIEAFRDDIRKRLLMPCNCGGNGIDPSSNAIIAINLETLDDGTIGSYAPNAPDDTFNHDTSETTPEEAGARLSSLCRAVDSYVDTIIVAMVNDADNSVLALGIIAAIITALNPVAGMIFAGFTASAVALINELGADQQAINDVKCCLLAGLKDKENTFDNFKISLANCGFTALSNASQLAFRVDQANHFQANYRAFNSFLSLSYGMEQSIEDCPFCEGWCYNLDFTQSAFADIVQIISAETSAGAGYVASTGFVAGAGEQVTIKVDLPVGSWLTDFADKHGVPGNALLATQDRDLNNITTSYGASNGWAVQAGITDTDPARVRVLVVAGTITDLFIRGHGIDPFSETQCDGTLPY
jgi:hypothetical protein